MSLLKPFIRDNALQRPVSIGDLLGASETIAALATAGAGTITGAILANNIINRTGPTGAVADTFDTATNIINALGGNAQQGDSWRVRYINTVAFALTLTAATGVTITGNAVINASSVKEFLVQITNATPASIVSAATTNGSAVITGMSLAQTSAITPGMLATGTGIAASATVLSVQPGVGVTLSGNSTATAAIVAVTFAPTVTITNLGQGLL